jgi:hypothetical protein
MDKGRKRELSRKSPLGIWEMLKASGSSHYHPYNNTLLSLSPAPGSFPFTTENAPKIFGLLASDIRATRSRQMKLIFFFQEKNVTLCFNLCPSLKEKSLDILSEVYYQQGNAHEWEGTFIFLA